MADRPLFENFRRRDGADNVDGYHRTRVGNGPSLRYRDPLSFLCRFCRCNFLGLCIWGGDDNRPILWPTHLQGLCGGRRARPLLHPTADHDGAFVPISPSVNYLRASYRFDPSALNSAILFFTAALSKAISFGA